MGRLSYNELASTRFKKTRDVVISEAFQDNGEKVGYSIAERLTVLEGEEETKVFLRGGLGIVDKEGLLKIKEAVDNAIEKIENK